MVPLPDTLIASPSQRLSGRVAVPGDKSISHRALILGALAQGQTHIEGLLESDDVLRTAIAIQMLGAKVFRSSDTTWLVDGAEWVSPADVVDCGNSGTAARLLMGAAAAFPIDVTFDGDASLRRRPMSRILEPLRAMGVAAEASDHLPLTVRGGELSGVQYRNIHSSAQVKSAILLAGLKTSGRVEVFEPLPTRDHTEQMLRQFGCEVDIIDFPGGRTVRLGKKRDLRSTHVIVPGDPSSAAFPLVAALITRDSDIRIKGVLDTPLRSGLLTTLVAMGAKLELENRRVVGGMPIADIRARSSELTGVEVPAFKAPSMIDEYPALAVAAAFARGRTIMRGVSELTVKESNRLTAIVQGLRACGVTAKAEGDALIVEGKGVPPPGGTAVDTFGDHRIAMSFFTLGLGSRDPVSVNSAPMIDTSFPGFLRVMRSLGANFEFASDPSAIAEHPKRRQRP